jgi:TDG/mug DNA glycosylase family protein
VDRRTAILYERGALEWISARGPRPAELRRIDALVRELPRGSVIADLGSGSGACLRSAARRGVRAVAHDSSQAMLEQVALRVPDAARVRADLAALPFARGSLDAAIAVRSYLHVPVETWPLALARLHAALRVGAPLVLCLLELDALEPGARERRLGEARGRINRGPLPGRLLCAVSEQRAREILEAAGFERIERLRTRDKGWLWLRARRAHTLPDFVRPGLDLLICGLNPSLHAAHSGIPFSRPGNRFWPAALRAGLAARDRDPLAALQRGIGFTDVCKRPTRSAGELAPAEHARGMARLEREVRRWRPRAVCFVGLEGWRRAVDRTAFPGPIAGGFAGRPAYLMPSTSGLNAGSSLAQLTAHLRRAYTLARH